MADAKAAIKDYEEQISLLQQEREKTEHALSNAAFGVAEAHEAIAAVLLHEASPKCIALADQFLGGQSVRSRQSELAERSAKLTADLAEIETQLGGSEQKKMAEHFQGLQEKHNLAEERHNEARRQLEPYRDDNLVWLRDNPQPDAGILNAFMDSMSGKKKRRESLLSTILSKFKAKSMEEIDTKEKNQRLETDAAKTDLELASDELEEFASLLKKHRELSDWLEESTSGLLSTLRSVVISQLEGMDLVEFSKRLPEEIKSELKLHIGKALTLAGKVEVLGEISKALLADINDRQERKNKVSSVLRKWKRSSKTYLKADKSEWLRTLPERQFEKTRTRLGYYDRCYEATTDFEDFLTYYWLLEMSESALPPYAVFSHTYHEPLAPAAFVSEIFPEYSEWEGPGVNELMKEERPEEMRIVDDGENLSHDDIEGEASEALLEESVVAGVAAGVVISNVSEDSEEATAEVDDSAFDSDES